MLARRQRTRASLLAALLLLACAPALARTKARHKPQPAKQRPKGALMWSDEFNGPDGSAPDPAKWTYDIGVDGNGWGNQELEYYTQSTANVVVRGGNLVITAVREKYSGPTAAPAGEPGASPAAPVTVSRDYTSTRIKTEGLFAQAYGRIEARIKIPRGQGMWPAFWMMGDDIEKVGWPKCGEIDIMENIGKEPSEVHGSLHGPGPGDSGTDDMTKAYTLPRGQRFADAFHVFAVEWDPRQMRFYVDSHLYFTAEPREMPHGTGWVFNHPFFVILNLAVGGSWPGNPDSSTEFPQQMLVDYVRVYGQAPAP
ncbi:MAG TPA: glycoside hydrolase family 16 protein [Terriglobia bacterium]|nr:glycoside hydrolase family 16 protein [Terriglobia bacterium]